MATWNRIRQWGTAAVVVMACSAPAAAQVPGNIKVQRELNAAVSEMWEHSALFRDQCARIAEAEVTVLLTVVHPSMLKGARAKSLIYREGPRVTLARASIGFGPETIELIAHEFEHILEQIEGLSLAQTEGRRGVRRTASGDAFETERAIKAGRLVRDEVRRHATLARRQQDAGKHPGLAQDARRGPETQQ